MSFICVSNLQGGRLLLYAVRVPAEAKQTAVLKQTENSAAYQVCRFYLLKNLTFN